MAENDCPDYMNNFLVSAGPSLAANLSPTPFRDTFDSFLSDLKLTRITIDQTLEVIDSIDIRKSSAIDCLTSRGLKDAFNGLPIQLKFIFNLSIDVGTFPASWKRANVILIPKEGPKCNPNNYSPISLLPIPGKLLEKLVHYRLLEFRNKQEILTIKLGGF